MLSMQLFLKSGIPALLLSTLFAPLLHVLAVPVNGSTAEDEVGAAASYWLEGVQHQGRAAFNSNPGSYQVWRNVKDYGAKGDGSTDDANAINAAIQAGARCGQGCDSSTVTPALIYFPAGTYLVSKPIVAMYYSQLVGDPTNLPTLKGSSNFAGIGIVDSDPYDNSGNNWYTNQNNFFRSVRNFIIDTTSMPLSAGTGIHWQVAQASSLVNIRFKLSTAAGNLHQGIFMDNGSGGFMSDLTFEGGRYGAFFGNQQFATRNLVFNNCQTAIYVNWDWQWTFSGITINNCGVAIDIAQADNSGAQGVGSVILLDAKITDTTTGLKTRFSSSSSPTTGGSAVLDNVQLTNVGTAVQGSDGSTILAGGTRTIDLWVQGNMYSKNNAMARTQAATNRPFAKPSSLLTTGSNTFFSRSRPLYTDVAASSFISVRSNGAKGDGSTDDTAALQNIFNTYGGNANNVIYFDHGVYIVSNTVTIPKNTRIQGEVWPVIMAKGSAFQDINNPKPVFKAGNAGDQGKIEIVEMIFQTAGPQPGAILLQWNSADPSGQQGVNGIWDVHFRVAGSAGTNLQTQQCAKTPSVTVTPNTNCIGAFMLLHIGKTASLYMENNWAWTADHNLDGPDFGQITVYNGRGVYVESTNGPVWMYASAAEHNVLYQYTFANTKNIFMAMSQTETPYFQANPDVTKPFASLSAWNDPDYSSCTTAACRKSWGLRLVDSSNFLSYGSGFYSFFENYNQDCINTKSCQDSMVDIRGGSNIVFYNHNTVAVSNLITYNGAQLAQQSANTNTFANTVAMFNS